MDSRNLLRARGKPVSVAAKSAATNPDNATQNGRVGRITLGMLIRIKALRKLYRESINSRFLENVRGENFRIVRAFLVIDTGFGWVQPRARPRRCSGASSGRSTVNPS